ncbi:anti-sigma factor [Pseudoduganella ginsengisoli]|uniref:Anti-sigma factor n=1 Tax=Pseudoduganella ginsengisoli TaxID=1462440 RepID=A0A6L6Q5U9_9BURK|nr:anti-sigma factor [Pseudoduganella ginsengisoli]MTW05050.1 anti-sigma factor [Pseudoduganella ginsengisoli]
MNPVTEVELQAWVDGKLDQGRQADISSYLKTHPQEGERLRAYRQQNIALRALYGPVLDETIPRTMLRTRNLSRWLWPMRRYATSMALMVSSATLGWVAHAYLAEQQLMAGAPGPVLATRALQAHAVYLPEVRHPVEVAADEPEHLTSWLSKRMGMPLQPPRLAPHGFDLVGGRILPGDAGPAAQIMYADAAGQRLTLYISAVKGDRRDTAFRYAQDGQVGVYYWIDGQWGYAVSGVLDKNTLARVARAVYEQL